MCLSYQLQRQKESFVLEEREVEGELVTLSQSKQTLKDAAVMKRVMKTDTSSIPVCHVFY